MIAPYISGPMTGISNHNFPLFFHVAKRLEEFKFKPHNPAASAGDTWKAAYDYAVAHPQTWEEYIKADTKAVLETDSIVLLPGWEKSKGACIEIVVSVAIGNEVWLWRESDSKEKLYLDAADRGSVYDTSLRYLLQCGLGGVDLTVEGYANYV